MCIIEKLNLQIAFNARVKAYQTYQQADSELQRKLALFEKVKAQQKNKPDKLAASQQEINEMKQRVEELEQEFDDISKLIKSELDRFDKEKVEDFRDSVQQFLCSMIEHQKQVIHKEREEILYSSVSLDCCAMGNIF